MSTYIIQTNNPQQSIHIDFLRLSATIKQLTDTEITSIEQYRDFVYQWREVEKQVVADIKFCRAIKNTAKQSGDSKLCNESWTSKHTLRRLANKLYQLRILRKQQLKRGKTF